MAKKNTEAPEEQPISDEVDSPELMQAKIDALTDQVLVLENNLEALQAENAVLRAHLDRLQEVTTQVANSASIAQPPPPPLERPTVEIEGATYRFKIGEVRLSHREVVKSTDLANDETRLYEVFGKFPGLFQKIS